MYARGFLMLLTMQNLAENNMISIAESLCEAFLKVFSEVDRN
jgi:hypothetical protein